MGLRLSDFDYHLPQRLIAQHPSQTRDRSRLMVVNRAGGDIQHRHFHDLPALLAADDLLVLNDSRVIPARLYAQRPGRTRPIEILLLKHLGGDRWEALLRPGKRVRTGSTLVVSEGVLEAEVLPSASNYRRRLHWRCRGDFQQLLREHGQMPLPPYIQRTPGGQPEDLERYQTVYADRPGSVAAPTAGLHFTPALLQRLRHVFLTLHVGYGTFRPIQSEEVTDHQMDAEVFEIPEETARAVEDQRAAADRVVTVGSTSTRVLEHLALQEGRIRAGTGETDLFIYPGHEWRVSQALITNFHLPRSTLFVLVSAFAGRDLMQRCYGEAVQREYRFYSYGDAMLIL